MKMFGKWDVAHIKVQELALQPYMNIDAILVPRSSGRLGLGRLYGKKIPIVERLMNKMMVAGHRGKKHKLSSYRNTGKSVSQYKRVLKVFTIIEQKTKKNPIEVYVKAIENAAPREEITTIEYGGARYPQAVEVAPQRRVDIALRFMVQGAYQKAFNSKKSAEECLAEEIIAAYAADTKSAAISKKLELERQADASR